MLGEKDARNTLRSGVLRVQGSSPDRFSEKQVNQAANGAGAKHALPEAGRPGQNRLPKSKRKHENMFVYTGR